MIFYNPPVTRDLKKKLPFSGMSNVPFLGPLWFPTFVDAVQRRDLNAPIGPLQNGGATHIANKRCGLRADQLGTYIIIRTPATPGGV